MRNTRISGFFSVSQRLPTVEVLAESAAAQQRRSAHGASRGS